MHPTPPFATGTMRTDFGLFLSLLGFYVAGLPLNSPQMPRRMVFILLVLGVFQGGVWGQSEDLLTKRGHAGLANHNTVTRKGGGDAGGGSPLERSLRRLMERMDSPDARASGGQELNGDKGRVIPVTGNPSLEATKEGLQAILTTVFEDTDMEIYLNALKLLYTIYQPLFAEQALEELPGALVCALLDREDCGGEASGLAAQAFRYLQSLLDSMQRQSCRSTQASNLGRSLVTSFQSLFPSPTPESPVLDRLADFQDRLLTWAGLLPRFFSARLSDAWHVFIKVIFPTFANYVADVLSYLILTPTGYLQTGLEILVDVPVMDQNEQCQQGDLKQLLMWGMSHNVSWNFGDLILDIFLPSEPPLCSYPAPECQAVQFTRSLLPSSPPEAWSCDPYNFTQVQGAICSRLRLTGQPSAAVSSLCKALSNLSAPEAAQVWNSGCRSVHTISSLLYGGMDCQSSSQRARSTLSLRELVCLYANWTQSGRVDPASVSFCSENDKENFFQGVCYNGRLLPLLMQDANNAWLSAYCTNFSDADAKRYYCKYSTWVPETVDPSVLSFCWTVDQAGLEKALCNDLELFLRIFANPGNAWLSINCSLAEPPTEVPASENIADLCRYSEWKESASVDMVTVSICAQHDGENFNRIVCTDAKILEVLMSDKENVWVKDYCASYSSVFNNSHLSTAAWCTYDQWMEGFVDPSVVALCWQNDQLTFSKNVCCNMALFEKLSLELQNEWLLSACGENDTGEAVGQACRYSEWSLPAVIDMTDVAVCADYDKANFTQWVCANETLLQNLLANLDNTWLVEFCANLSGSGSVSKLKPAERCLYESWAVELPDSSLLALCWDLDHAKFVSLVCKNSFLLSLLTQEPSSFWVGTLCATYNIYSNQSSGNNTEPKPCFVRDLVRQLNWSCSVDFTAVCQQSSSQLRGLQHFLQCGIEAIGLKTNSLITEQVSTAFAQAANQVVILLVVLEDNRLISFHASANIHLSVLESVRAYLEYEKNFENKRVLLQCFGNVLTSMMQTAREVSHDGFFLIKEYFKIPLKNLRAVLAATDSTTARQILQYLTRNMEAVQITQDYLRILVSVFLQKHLYADSTIFVDLAPLLPYATVPDILSLPPLQGNTDVLNIINANLQKLSLDQKKAFGKWFSSSSLFLNTSSNPPTFIQDTGDLIVYLPFSKFQSLSSVQIFNGLDVLLNNSLSSLQSQFVAQSILKAYRNLSSSDIKMLGNLTCFASTVDLLAYKKREAFATIQENVKECIQQGLAVPGEMISGLFLSDSGLLKNTSSLSAQQLSDLAELLPWLGLPFLRQLSSAQLLAALPALHTSRFTPAQAWEIVDKISQSNSLAVTEQLSALGSLISGVRVETLQSLPGDVFLAALPNITAIPALLSPAQTNAITAKLWGSQEISGRLASADSLLPFTALLSVRPHASLLLANLTTARKCSWNTQQAKVLFKEALKTLVNMSTDDFLRLGTVVQGTDCGSLRHLFLSRPSVSSISTILTFLRDLPVDLHTSVKKCINEELYSFNFFPELLGKLGSQIALEISVSTIKNFPVDMMNTLKRMIVGAPLYFLRLPNIKQVLLVDKIVQRLGMHTGEFSKDEFESLGAMATFVVDEIFVQINRQYFVENIEHIRSFCFNKNKKEIVGRILQENATFGPVPSWTSQTLDQVDRFVFFLPRATVQQLPPMLMTQERIEKLFLGQQKWESSEFGALCQQNTDASDLRAVFESQQFTLQHFLGFLRPGKLSRITPTLVPSCESLRATRPSAWSVDSLTSMPAEAFVNCLELIGQEPFFTPYELTLLLNKVKQIYGPASSFSPSVVAQLGYLAVRLTDDELSRLVLSDLRAVSALGQVDTWSPRQLSVLFGSVLNSTKLTASKLDSNTLVALGYIVCGIKTADMTALNPVEFSKAVLWIGRINLPCSEQQLGSLVGLLSQAATFGPISSWGPEVFMEIGSVAGTRYFPHAAPAGQPEGAPTLSLHRRWSEALGLKAVSKTRCVPSSSLGHVTSQCDAVGWARPDVGPGVSTGAVPAASDPVTPVTSCALAHM
ncbi:stereocilin isoform X3 [Lepisosteus oculatus]|uniref:stereocilin isoform X3 n=1 Tax=Lepisosteus oculatus TaxID=7918 RepID=UPI0037123D61